MWEVDGEKLAVGERSIVIDWEMVGIGIALLELLYCYGLISQLISGSGPQDVAQYLISHASDSDRLKHERTLVEEYYACLTGSPKYWTTATTSEVCSEKYSWEDCWRDYIEGGSERWVWLLALLSGMCPDPMVQYFQDQLASFIISHNITPASIGMPRV
jgi:hypothetical protein